MFSNFGNINDMTKSQFQKAIEYYQNKIKTMTEDKDISDDAKHWFLHQYNERLKSLQTALEELDLAINRARNSSAFVDESRATLSGMGTISSSYNNFDNLAQDEHRYRVSQGWKIAGAILLPLVGTIPFLRSWNAARKRHNAIEAKINSENVELGNFISKEKRPYEATLLTSTKFTEEEMANLLEDTAELNRIANLATATPSPITPVQRKNLISKLVDVREFGQKNGYNVGSILTDPAFKTSVDKTLNKTATHEAAYNSINSTAATLKQAYDSIKQLEELRTKVQELYNSSKEQRLETLLSNIDSKIATLKTHAKTKINDGVNDIVTKINGSYPTSADVPGYTAAINNVNGFVDNANPTHFGAGVNAEQARRMAEELFTAESDEYKKFDEIDPAKTAKLTEFETEREKVKNKADLATRLVNLRTLLTATTKLKQTPTQNNISYLQYLLSQATSDYEYLKQNIDSFEESDKGRILNLQSTLNERKNVIEKASFRFAPTPSDYANYKSWANQAINPTANKNHLKNQLDKLNEAKFNLESDSFKTMMTEIDPRFGPEIEKLIATATSKIDQVKKLIEKIEKSDDARAQITTFEDEIDSFTFDDKNAHKSIEARLTAIEKWINSQIGENIDNDAKTKLNTLRNKVYESITQLETAKSTRSLTDIMKDANNILSDILSSGNFTDKQVKSLSILKKELQRYSSEPAAQAIIDNINNYASTHGKSL